MMMQDLGETKQILGIEVHRDGKNGMVKILMSFGMNTVKPVNIL